MAPVRRLLLCVLPNNVEQRIADPFHFTEDYSTVDLRNNLNPNIPAAYHLDAEHFVEQLKEKVFLVDPPYSVRQANLHYDGFHFEHERMKDLRRSMVNKLKLGGLIIMFGWSSVGMNDHVSFKRELTMIIAHGGYRYDTIVTIDRMVNTNTQSNEKSTVQVAPPAVAFAAAAVVPPLSYFVPVSAFHQLFPREYLVRTFNELCEIEAFYRQKNGAVFFLNECMLVGQNTVLSIGKEECMSIAKRNDCIMTMSYSSNGMGASHGFVIQTLSLCYCKSKERDVFIIVEKKITF